MDESDDLEAKKCSKCGCLMIKQEIDLKWVCENCDKPHGKEPTKEKEDVGYRTCSNCGKNSGIFDLCIDCRPSE